MPQGRRRILGDRHMRKQGVILKQHADIAAMRRNPVIGRSSRKISPALGATARRIIRRVVVLPQPKARAAPPCCPARWPATPDRRPGWRRTAWSARAVGRRLPASAGQAPKTWLYLSSNFGRIGLMKVQSGLKICISSIFASGYAMYLATSGLNSRPEMLGAVNVSSARSF